MAAGGARLLDWPNGPARPTGGRGRASGGRLTARLAIAAQFPIYRERASHSKLGQLQIKYAIFLLLGFEANQSTADLC